MSLSIPTECHECEGTMLSWVASVRNLGPAQDGRIRLHEVENIFLLACDECSETIMVVNGDVIAGLLNRAVNEKLNEVNP